MKRLLSLMLVVMMVMALFAACGDQQATETSNKKEAEETQDQTKQKTTQGKTEVTILLWDKNEEKTAQGEWTRNRQQLFSEKYPYIKISRQAIPQQESSGSSSPDRIAFTTAMSAGTAPDAYNGGHFPTMQVWIDQGFAHPLDDYTKDWSDFQDFIPAVLKSGQKDAKTYGIPWYAYVMNFAFRKDLYQATGLNPDVPPKTWEEMIEFSKKLTKPDKSQYGFGMIGKDVTDWWFQFYVWQAGGDLSTLNQDKTVNISLNSIAAKTALQFYKDLKWTYDVFQPDITKDFGEIVSDFATGKCAQILYTGEWYSWTKSLGLTDEQLGMAIMPAGPSGKNTASNGGAYWFINPKSSKDKQDAAWEYIKFFCSKEAMIDKYQFIESKGERAPIASAYSNVIVSDYIKIPEDWAKATTDALADSREEYVLVDRIRPYLNKAIESVLTDKNADIAKLLDEAQKITQKEVIDLYNAEIKK